jgi:hypothetical protein
VDQTVIEVIAEIRRLEQRLSQVPPAGLVSNALINIQQARFWLQEFIDA